VLTPDLSALGGFPATQMKKLKSIMKPKSEAYHDLYPMWILQSR
jgi:hypothetical protein